MQSVRAHRTEQSHVRETPVSESDSALLCARALCVWVCERESLFSANLLNPFVMWRPRQLQRERQGLNMTAESWKIPEKKPLNEWTKAVRFICGI